MRDEAMKVKINASYYFGEPLANAKLDVQFFYVWPVKARVTGSFVTDANGEATLSFPAPYDPNYDDYYYWRTSSSYQRIRMEVTANDGSNQNVTGIYTFSVFPASEQLSLEIDGYFAKPGQPYIVTARTMDLFKQPAAGREVTLTVYSWNRTKFDFDKKGQTIQLQTDAICGTGNEPGTPNSKSFYERHIVEWLGISDRLSLWMRGTDHEPCLAECRSGTGGG